MKMKAVWIGILAVAVLIGGGVVLWNKELSAKTGTFSDFKKELMFRGSLQ